MNTYSLYNPNCSTLALFNAEAYILNQSYSAIITAKLNCCVSKTYGIVYQAGCTVTKTCISDNPATFNLNIGLAGITPLSAIFTNNPSQFTVVQVDPLNYTVTIINPSCNDYLNLTLVTGTGSNCYISVQIVGDGDNICNNVGVYIDSIYQDYCGLSMPDVYDFYFTSPAFLDDPCGSSIPLGTGVFSIQIDTVDSNGIIIDKQCIGIFTDCDNLICKILAHYKENTKESKDAVRHYFALQQYSLYLNDVNNSLNCKNYLDCSDLCDLYRLVLQEIREDIETVSNHQVNIADCGCNK